MPIHHDTPENPSGQEPHFEEKSGPFTAATGTHPISTNPAAPGQSPEPNEAANSAPPESLGGLVDPQEAALQDGT